MGVTYQKNGLHEWKLLSALNHLLFETGYIDQPDDALADRPASGCVADLLDVAEVLRK